MARKPDEEDEDEFDGDVDDDEILEDFDDIDDKPSTMRFQQDARRILEQLREDKELDRLINGNFYD